MRISTSFLRPKSPTQEVGPRRGDGKKKTNNGTCHQSTRLPLFLTPNTPSFKTSYFLLTFHHTTHSTLILLSHSPLNNPHSYYHITIAPLTIHIHSLLTCHSHHHHSTSSHWPCVCLPFSLLFLAMFLRHYLTWRNMARGFSCELEGVWAMIAMWPGVCVVDVGSDVWCEGVDDDDAVIVWAWRWGLELSWGWGRNGRRRNGLNNTLLI